MDKAEAFPCPLGLFLLLVWSKTFVLLSHKYSSCQYCF